MAEHISSFDEDDAGWPNVNCSCGYSSPPLPDMETAADVWGDHRAASVVADTHGDYRWLVGWLGIHAPDGVALPPRLAPLVKECMEACSPSRFTLAVPLKTLRSTDA